MAPEGDYFGRFLKEGAARAEDTAFAPGLQQFLAKLYKRQRYEAQELHLEQGEDVRRIGTPHHPVLNRGHLADRAAQEKRFTEERERHIREYHDAQRIREQLRQNDVAQEKGRSR